MEATGWVLVVVEERASVREEVQEVVEEKALDLEEVVELESPGPVRVVVVVRELQELVQGLVLVLGSERGQELVQGSRSHRSLPQK